MKFAKQNRLKGRFVGIFAGGLACILLLLFGGYLVTDYVASKAIHGDESEGETIRQEVVEVPEEYKKKQLNILIVGIDSGSKRSTNLTDVLMIANLNTETNKVNILQIPRDTYVGYHSVFTGKVNAVYNAGRADGYGKGINGLMNCISDQFKIHLDHYVMVNLNGFRDIVEAMGGLKITFDEAFSLQVDKIWYHYKQGEQVLTPKQAEALVRERDHYMTGDIGRVQNGQRWFLTAFIKQVKEMSKTELLRLAPVLFSYVRTDMSYKDGLSYLDPALKVKMSEITMVMVPGEGYYDRSHGQSLYSAHVEPLVKIINERFRVGMSPVTKEDLSLVELSNTTSWLDDNDQTMGDLSGEESPTTTTTNS